MNSPTKKLKIISDVIHTLVKMTMLSEEEEQGLEYETLYDGIVCTKLVREVLDWDEDGKKIEEHQTVTVVQHDDGRVSAYFLNDGVLNYLKDANAANHLIQIATDGDMEFTKNLLRVLEIPQELRTKLASKRTAYTENVDIVIDDECNDNNWFVEEIKANSPNVQCILPNDLKSLPTIPSSDLDGRRQI